MMINTEYNIGHRFYAPRVHYVYSEDTKVIDGYQYKREIGDLVTAIKEYTVYEISCTVDCNNNVTVDYWCECSDDSDYILYKSGKLDDLVHTTVDSAQMFANDWINTHNECYYGGH